MGARFRRQARSDAVIAPARTRPADTYADRVIDQAPARFAPKRPPVQVVASSRSVNLVSAQKRDQGFTDGIAASASATTSAPRNLASRLRSSSAIAVTAGDNLARQCEDVARSPAMPGRQRLNYRSPDETAAGAVGHGPGRRSPECLKTEPLPRVPQLRLTLTAAPVRHVIGLCARAATERRTRLRRPRPHRALTCVNSTLSPWLGRTGGAAFR